MEQPLARYQKFGAKTLAVFMSRYAHVAIMTFIIGGLIIFGLTFVPEEFQNIVSIINYIVIGLGIFVIFVSLLMGWLTYSHYRIEIYNDFLKIVRGVIVVEEIGIPYKRIVEIKVKRTFAEQMIGLANIEITVFREDDKSTPQNEALMVLPALTNEIASEIQHHILGRTNLNETTSEEPISGPDFR